MVSQATLPFAVQQYSVLKPTAIIVVPASRTSSTPDSQQNCCMANDDVTINGKLPCFPAFRLLCHLVFKKLNRSTKSLRRSIHGETKFLKRRRKFSCKDWPLEGDAQCVLFRFGVAVIARWRLCDAISRSPDADEILRSAAGSG